MPSYVPEGVELTDVYFTEYGCLTIKAIMHTSVAEQLAIEYINIIIDFDYI